MSTCAICSSLIITGGITPFVQLLERVNAIPGIARIRFTSPHPRGFKEDLIAALIAAVLAPARAMKITAEGTRIGYPMLLKNLGYALVPLYNVLCAVTGYGDRAELTRAAAAPCRRSMRCL